MWSVRRRCSWRMCCTWGLPRRCSGRLANLLLFAALAALAVKVAPFGKRVFTVAALLPMTLHLAASFSRDAPLLGLCFAFTALLLDAAFGPESRRLSHPAGAAAGLWCAAGPGKRLPAAGRAVAEWCPQPGWAATPKQKKCGYLAVCPGAGPAAEHRPAGRHAAQWRRRADGDERETTETTAEAENIEDTDRTPRGRPEERDADYEVEICTVTQRKTSCVGCTILLIIRGIRPKRTGLLGAGSQ